MNSPEIMEPSACTWCGIAQRGHGRQYADAAGWHNWEKPSQEQMLARMKARRLQLAVARMGALPVPVGVEHTLDVVEEELTGVNLALWEEVRAYARLRLALTSAQRGRREARARVAELETERHSTNEALSEAAEALRENRNRIAERPAVERHRREIRESYQWLAAHAREDGDFEGEAVVLQQLAEREQLWAQEDVLAREFAADPLAVKPWTPGPSAEASADKLTQLLAPTQVLREDPHDSPLHHPYKLGRDLPQMGGA